VVKSKPLTAVAVAKLCKPGRYADGGGLYLQISKWKTKAWLFRFVRHGRERQMGLGPVALISLAEARDRAWRARRQLLDGHDPIEARRAERAEKRAAEFSQITFEQCATDFIALHRASWRNDKHAAQWSSTLATYAFPVIGAVGIGVVDTPLLLKVLRPIWNEKTDTATRLRGRIEKILDWARVSGHRSGENPARWKGHPAMPYSDIPAFMCELRARKGVSALALEFLILTATRTGEVIHMKRGEIDFKSAIWTVPASRTKSGREHRVPLSQRAIELLAPSKNAQDGACVFSGARAEPLSNMAMLELLRGMRPGLTVHGFRSTFKDWAAETTAHENIVTEMALAHAVGDEVEAAYRRGDLFAKRKKLMDDWTAYCSRTPGNTIVSFRRRRARAEA
jgi:integrase